MRLWWKSCIYYFGQAVKMHNIDFYTKLALNCPPERAVHSKVVNKMTHSIYHYKSSLTFYFPKENDSNNFSMFNQDKIAA